MGRGIWKRCTSKFDRKMERIAKIKSKGIWRDNRLSQGIWNRFIEIAYNNWINSDTICLSFCLVFTQFRRPS